MPIAALAEGHPVIRIYSREFMKKRQDGSSERKIFLNNSHSTPQISLPYQALLRTKGLILT
jgi:hypothetical protein